MLHKYFPSQFIWEVFLHARISSQPLFHLKNPAMQDFYRSFNRDCELVSQLPIAFFPAVFFWSVSYLHRFLLSSGFFSQIKRKLKKIPVSLLSDQTILCRLPVSFFLFLKDPVIHAFVLFHPGTGCIGIPGDSFAGYIQFLTDLI